LGLVLFKMKVFRPHIYHRRTIPLLLALLIIGLFYQFSHQVPHIQELKFQIPEYFRSSEPNSKFWRQFAPILVATEPKCGGKNCELPKIEKNAPARGRYQSDSWKTDSPQNLMDMPEEWSASMRDSHDLFVNTIKSRTPKLDYVEGTRGIVTSAGGAYFPVLLVSLLMLRRTGSKLPVEVLVASREEYEPLICEVVYPALNAKCIILSEILGHSRHKFQLSGYAYKVYAMLFSSFEEILLLDSDNFPIHPPELLFEEAPYTSHHFVLWPDLWIPTFSPLFANITNIDVELLQRRPTIEAGQILISKKTHTKSLLLAAYYNTYGRYYYGLTTQGGPGEGDKETFAAAAIVLNETLYTVNQPPRTLGMPGNGAELLQADPIADLRCESYPNCTTAPRPFFLHCGWPPKMNALHNIRSTRQFGGEELSMQLFGEDLEPIVWGYMVEMACDPNLEFRDWGEGNKSSTAVCEQTEQGFKDMFGRDYIRTGLE
jgi:alpha 1,2-mannosyltransferase